MPIYEYGCYDCRKRVNVFFRSFSAAEEGEAVCPRCGGTNLKRLISRVAFVRSEESRLDDLTDPSSFGDFDEDDPKSMARWMRQMSNEMGEDLGPEFDEVMDRLEAGQSPDEIENELPDLGMSDDAGGGDDWLGD
ncbi:MAG: zinc ribbon domain-containing protein [Anaerolineae bacterium]